MKLRPLSLEGAFLLEAEPLRDERGYFARTYDERTFGEAGLPTRWPQCNTSQNRRRGTLRGLHFQSVPHAEARLVRCTRGAIFDVGVDLRPGSPTFGRWEGAELSAENLHALYWPEGFAHGFQVLADDSEVFYMMSAVYEPTAQRGLRFDDPTVGIVWPVSDAFLSDRDRAFPLLGALR